MHRHSDIIVDALDDVVELVGHVLHAVRPGASEYVPTSQALHLPSGLVIVPKKPGLHLQSVIALLPGCAVSELSGHFVHVPSPSASAYCPAGHCVHLSDGCVMVPLDPFSHWHSVTALLAVVTVVASFGHSMQAAALVVPRYLPLSHALHVSVGEVTTPE